MNDKNIPSLDNPHIDKNGAELDRQRFKMLQDIAKELSSETVFPTSFDTMMRLRKALQDPNLNMRKLTTLITMEPLISAKLFVLANSVVYNPGGKEIRDLQRIIERLGLQTVRSTSLAIAMKQLVLARSVVGFQEQAERLWKHSLHSASAAYVVAKRLTRHNPEEALLAGMVHDIGAFYMIYRASQYEELLLRPDTTKHLVLRWHESIGHSLIIALGLPLELADAMMDHDQARAIPDTPKNLADIVYLANLLAGGTFEWLDMPVTVLAAENDKLNALKEQLGEEIEAHADMLKAAFD